METREQRLILDRIVPEPNSGCWLWLKGVERDGYGFITVDKHAYRAHRFAYAAWKGPIPEGLTIDHLCRVRSCMNPAHMEAVPSGVNVLRGHGLARANSAKTHCPKGHVYDRERLTRTGPQRLCSTCISDKSRARRVAGGAEYRAKANAYLREWYRRKKEGK